MRSHLASEIGMACCCTDVGRRQETPPSDPATGLGVEVDPCVLVLIEGQSSGLRQRLLLFAPSQPNLADRELFLFRRKKERIR
jgi:hypothetical protein